jgi:hypothetical protein
MSTCGTRETGVFWKKVELPGKFVELEKSNEFAQ